MDEKTKVAFAAAVAGGYVLGRSKKGRLALTAAAVLTGRSLEPRALLLEGVRRLRDLPQVSALGDQLRGEVYQAARAATGAAVSRRIGKVPGPARPGSPLDRDAQESEEAEEAETGAGTRDEAQARSEDAEEAGAEDAGEAGTGEEAGTSAERSRERRERSGRGAPGERAEEKPGREPRKAAKQPAKKAAQKPAKKPGTKPATKAPGKRTAPAGGSRGKPAAKKGPGGRSPSSTRTQRGR